jgi:glutaconyl-CoA/methylmalonyl-CoA decarboxylase subunit gamma
MNYKVKIEDRIFEVEVRDLYTRPILAVVDGIEIEVWPEENQTAVRTAGTAAQPAASGASARIQAASPTPPPFPTNGTAAVPSSAPLQVGNLCQVLAPIPGVILDVKVGPGETVEQGQALFILEAMKMKNTIRASRPATVARVNVKQGQTVKHHDLLLEYED